VSERRTAGLFQEAALVLVTLGALIGVGRLLDGDWALPLLASAVLAHLVVAVLRRRGVSLVPAALVTGLVAFLVVTWAAYAGTTAFGIPTGQTLDAIGTDFELAWELFRDTRAPAPVQTGFLVATSLALWFVAFVADWAAFRLWVPIESTLPATTLFIFTSLLGAPDGRTLAAASFAAAVLLFLLVHRITREQQSSRWVSEDAAGHRRLLLAGTSLAAVAVLAGAVVGPQLPGAEAEALVDYRGSLEGPDARVTISPLVDIRARLVEQADVEAFTVRATERSYWRLTSLEEFDGRIWRSSGSFGRAEGELPTADPSPAATRIEQAYRIEALAMLWLPAAYQPRTLDAGDASIRFDEDSSTFIVDRSLPASDGLTYVVISDAPRFDAPTLTAAGPEIPNRVTERYLALPESFPTSVTDEALRITADATTPYERALALQDHLQRFEYDLDVAPGHDDAALERFLFEDRRGYCEQFAGAYAAMARAVGLPARVAVGFTPGEADPEDPQVFHVRGEHAHAWPEVYLAGAGWVPFEPTPRRGIPFAEPYTGLPEQQENQPPGETPVGTTEAPAPGPEEPAEPDDPEAAEVETRDEELPALPSDEETEDEGAAPAAGLLDNPVIRAALGLGILVLLYLIAVPAALLAWRARRRRRASTPERQVHLAWTESLEHGSLIGLAPSPSDTVHERAALLATRCPEAAEDAAALAGWMEGAAYGPASVTAETAETAVERASQIETAVLARTSRPRRLRRWLDPRPLLRTAIGRLRTPARRVRPAPVPGPVG
jgi:hypothetical protein